MSPMKLRRVLLIQLWLMYDARGQMPLEWWCSAEDLVLEAGPGNWFANEVKGQPNTFRETIWAIRNLHGIVTLVSIFSGRARIGMWSHTYPLPACYPPSQFPSAGKSHGEAI